MKIVRFDETGDASMREFTKIIDLHQVSKFSIGPVEVLLLSGRVGEPLTLYSDLLFVLAYQIGRNES